ncbi:hypothetical protein R6Q59_007109 [Mikania micrantha]|uniref:DUF4220 domain-containing protein n=1 Tax=Mikania micrantha TaxID=192012 RepID=A0A5N6PZZ0_9ASTR|nr:hypothetical protein E3N88_00417 [Mikania micrantha]
MVQLISDDIQKLWNGPGLQGLILLSCVLQIILFVLGYLRKYNQRTLIETSIMWCVYNLAYAVIPTALTITSQTTSDVSRELISFWASLLFLHLGGPDTFTAYSMEDNDIWRRHLMFIVSQSVIALYIILLSFPGSSNLPKLSILVFFVGLVKCFGRVQALRQGSSEHLRGSMRAPADPGPDFVKFMEEYHLKKKQGFNVKVYQPTEHVNQDINAGPETPSKEILEAHRLFNVFERIFVDLTLTYEDRDMSTSYFSRIDSAKAFRVVEIELGFAYDKCYTKANVVYSFKGLILHSFVFLILLVFVAFYFLTDIGHYRVIDIFITYLVIAADVLKEILALFNIVFSDWTDVWLNKHNCTHNILKFTCLKQPTKRRWSNSIAQLDLLSVALEEKPAKVLEIQKMFGVDEDLEMQRYQTYTQVSANLKDMIYSQFKDFMGKNSENKPLCNHRGSYSLQQNNCTNLVWSIDDVEFDRSILIWHIATSLCFHSSVDDQSGVNRIESNHLSKYLLNLLVSKPEMLPMGNGMIRYRDTSADANRFFKNKGPCADKVATCRTLLRVDYDGVLPIDVIGDRSKTVLFDGVRLAQALLDMNEKSMWKVVSQVWIEILGYAAGNCKGLHHSQQLATGGQLLTHVWLLMAHLGLTEHFQVSQGHARAKLNCS